MRRVLVVAAAGTPAVLAVLLGLGMALSWRANAVPDDEWARFAGATEVSGFVIVVERDRERVRSGRETTYTIAVGNRGRAAEAINVRASVPPWLTPTPASAEVNDGYVEWSLVLPPGGVQTTELAGVYAAPRTAAEPAGGPAPVAGAPQRVTFTACAMDPAAGEPIVCDTDAAHLAVPMSGSSWGWIALGASTLAIATAVAAATLIQAGALRRVRHRLPRWRRAARGP